MLFAFIFGIAGARIYFIIQHSQFFIVKPLEIFTLWKGGFSSFGAIIGSSIGAVFYLKKAKINIWKFADCCAPSIAIGIFFTRIGCFMNGCCFGKLSDLPWSVRFPQGSGPFMFQLYYGKILPTEILSLPVHPVQLYESLVGILLFIVLIYFSKRKKADGQLFLGFLILYSVSRFFIEFYREDFNKNSVGVLSYIQVFSLFIALTGIVGYYLLIRKEKEQINSTGKEI